MVRILAIPLALIMFYFAAKAWGDSIGFLLSVATGAGFYGIVSWSIDDVIGSEIKGIVERVVKIITDSPVHVECSSRLGRLFFFIYLQEDNETVTKVIYHKIVEILRGNKYFNRIEILSMANVPDLKKETIEKFRYVMLENANRIAEKRRED